MAYELMKAREDLAKRIGEAIQANVKFAMARAMPDNHTATEMSDMRDAAEWSVVKIGHAVADWEGRFERELKEPSPW